MKEFTLKTRDINSLKKIQEALIRKQAFTNQDKKILLGLLKQLPPPEKLVGKKFPREQALSIKIQNTTTIGMELEKWKTLFGNLPGWDFCPFSFFVDEENKQLLYNNVIIVAVFAPSLSYNITRKDGYRVYLKDDGTATFSLPTDEDIKKYPQLNNFQGTWLQAYYLLIKTLRKGWPMEKFPDELQQFLPM